MYSTSILVVVDLPRLVPTAASTIQYMLARILASYQVQVPVLQVPVPIIQTKFAADLLDSS